MACCAPRCAPCCPPRCPPRCAPGCPPPCAPGCPSPCAPRCPPRCPPPCGPGCPPPCAPRCPPPCGPQVAPCCAPRCCPPCQPCAPTWPMLVPSSRGCKPSPSPPLPNIPWLPSCRPQRCTPQPCVKRRPMSPPRQYCALLPCCSPPCPPPPPPPPTRPSKTRCKVPYLPCCRPPCPPPPPGRQHPPEPPGPRPSTWLPPCQPCVPVQRPLITHNSVRTYIPTNRQSKLRDYSNEFVTYIPIATDNEVECCYNVCPERYCPCC